MSPRLFAYFQRARTPWASVVFVLPILCAYEFGLAVLDSSEVSRTGVDAGLRNIANLLGLAAPFAVPAILMTGLLAWAWRSPSADRQEPVETAIGMAAESVVFAGLLFGLVQIVLPTLAWFGTRVHESFPRPLELSPGRTPEATWELLVRFLGAGLYEETVFRLIGLSLFRRVLLAGDLDARWANLLAAVASSFLFAAAHHWSGAEAFHLTIFLYRVMAGLFFAAVFQTRGFGIAVGSHVGFDVLVSLVLRQE